MVPSGPEHGSHRDSRYEASGEDVNNSLAAKTQFNNHSTRIPYTKCSD